MDDIHPLLTNQPAASALKLTVLRDQERLELSVITAEAGIADYFIHRNRCTRLTVLHEQLQLRQYRYLAPK